MATVLEDIDRSSRLLFVFKSIGDVFIRMVGLASVIEKFVWGERETEQVEKKDGGEEKAVSSCFVAETQNILHFYSAVLKSDREIFRKFHDFSLKCGKPIATILSSSRVNCRKCGKKLAFENKVIPVYKPFVSCTRISLLKVIITCLTKFIQRSIHCVRGFRSCFICTRSLKVNFVCTCLNRHPHHKHFKHFYYKSRSVDSTVRKVKLCRLVATRDDSTHSVDSTVP